MHLDPAPSCSFFTCVCVLMQVCMFAERSVHCFTVEAPTPFISFFRTFVDPVATPRVYFI